MKEKMDELLATYADHNVFLVELASWLSSKAHYLNELKGSYSDVVDAANMLSTAAGSSDDGEDCQIDSSRWFAICVSHISPDNIAYVGPYSEQEARAALEKLDGFTHYNASRLKYLGEESWERSRVGGSEAVVLTIGWGRNRSEQFDFPPDLLAEAIGAFGVIL